MKKAKAGNKVKPIGKVTHYYGGLGVAIIKFAKSIKIGEMLRFKGATTDFDQVVVSMQYNHKDIKGAKKGQEVGIKVAEKVREGDGIYEV
jgi:putative protease